MPHSNSFCYEFEQYRFDPAQRLLTRDGQSIPLTPKATDILLILLKHAGQLVEKEKLINEVWPDTFVEEANVTQNIFTLRRALQDNGSGTKYIETVARRGYRFVASVRKVQTKTAASEAEEQELIASSVTSIGLSPILAVMPFTSTTGDTEFQYLAEGIPESIINSFSGLSQLRVISRSTAFRYKNKELDPQTIGQRLGADAVLVGKVCARERDLSVSVELVDVATGWQLWGDTFAGEREKIFEIQDQITKQVSRALRLPLTHEDEKHVAKRYTESATAYQAYLEGRYHWSKYTRVGIENAIGHFGRAIDLDPNYALAYAGIVDCYLRLATNYLPPEDALVMEKHSEAGTVVEGVTERDEQSAADAGSPGAVQEKVKLRHEWDWKGAERELRRANELKTDYPAAHQWHAAYVFARDLYLESLKDSKTLRADHKPDSFAGPQVRIPHQISSLELTANERAQVFCAVAREQIDSGNHDAGCEMLRPWWTWGNWPAIVGLKQESCADLLFTIGVLAGCVASARQIPKGQKHGEALLNGAIALFESLGAKARAAECRIELGLCYYRQGLFDLGRAMFLTALNALSTDSQELRSLCLIRLASLERHAGRFQDALERLSEAEQTSGRLGPWATGRCHLEYASTYRHLASIDRLSSNYHLAEKYYQEALHEFEAIGNHRLAAIAENNLGYMLIDVDRFEQAEFHLFRARAILAGFNDRVRGAQVNDTLARLHLAQGRFDLAEQAAHLAVSILEEGDEDALLAEALTTEGVTLCRMGRCREAKKILNRAYRVAERCGDIEGAGQALAVLEEEITRELDENECQELKFQIKKLLEHTERLAVRQRLENSLRRIDATKRSLSIGIK
jgi:DNA-binding winged helix-turn-helix (wHTH) protein/tetratricopeptide (TPR) repeat protein